MSKSRTQNNSSSNGVSSSSSFQPSNNNNNNSLKHQYNNSNKALHHGQQHQPGSTFDYFFEFPDDYELGDGGEFDLDGVITTSANVFQVDSPLYVSLQLFNQQEPQLPLFDSSSSFAISSTSTSAGGGKTTSASSSESFPQLFLHPDGLGTATRDGLRSVVYDGSHSQPEDSDGSAEQQQKYSMYEADGNFTLADGFSTHGPATFTHAAATSLLNRDAYHADAWTTAARNASKNQAKTVSSIMERHYAAEEAFEREKRLKLSGYNNGKNRLKIEFINLGGPGELKQAFGRKNGVIPDGLHGTNEVYNEPWEFEVYHCVIDGTVCIKWQITNISSKLSVSRTETPSEALLRQSQGKTVCNHVVRQALDERAMELEREIPTVNGNPLRIANLQSRAKALRPKRCLIGLLFFGLLHDAVQEHMAKFYSSSVVEDGETNLRDGFAEEDEDGKY